MTTRAQALSRAFSEPVSGPSYRPLTRWLAACVVLALFGWGAALLLEHGLASLDAPRIVAGAAVAAALLWPLPALLAGRTVVDATGVRQLGWGGREAAWTDMQRVRFLRVPMAPRLLVSVGFGRVRVFHSGSAELDAAFERATRLLTAPDREPT